MESTNGHSTRKWRSSVFVGLSWVIRPVQNWGGSTMRTINEANEPWTLLRSEEKNIKPHYPLVMTNSSPWKDPPFSRTVNPVVHHLFLWAIYTMAMLVITRGQFIHGIVCVHLWDSKMILFSTIQKVTKRWWWYRWYKPNISKHGISPSNIWRQGDRDLGILGWCWRVSSSNG